MAHVKWTNRKQVIRRHKRSQQNINEAVELGVRHAMIVMRDTAKEQAPVDDGLLEDSIKGRIKETPNQHVAEVFVDPKAVTEKGKPIEVYAEVQHEKLEPIGHHKLGKKSAEKQQHVAPGIKVGGGYMQRALTERKNEMLGAMDKTIRSVVRKDRRPRFDRLIEWKRLTRNFLRSSDDSK